MVILPENVTKKDIIYIGDFISLFPSYNNIVQRLPQEPVVYYDPNIRSEMDDAAFGQFMNNIERANIIRFSVDDVDVINKKIDILEHIKTLDHIFLILITYKNKVVYYLEGEEHELTYPQIKPVNTIGAGDNFNAGFLHMFQRHALDRESVKTNHEKLVQCIDFGIELAKRICMSDNSYLDEDFTLE